MSCIYYCGSHPFHKLRILVNIAQTACMDNATEDQELPWRQLCRHWWRHRLSLLPNLVKSWSHEIGCYNDRIALKFDRHLSSTAAEACQISEWSERFKPESRGFDTSRDLALRPRCMTSVCLVNREAQGSPVLMLMGRNMSNTFPRIINFIISRPEIQVRVFKTPVSLRNIKRS